MTHVQLIARGRLANSYQSPQLAELLQQLLTDSEVFGTTPARLTSPAALGPNRFRPTNVRSLTPSLMRSWSAAAVLPDPGA